MTDEIKEYDLATVTDMRIARPPAMVLEEAKAAATALMDVVKAKPKPVIFNGEQYLEYEDWQTVARFYGCVPRIVSTSPLQMGNVVGYEAVAEVIHVPSGRVVSTGEAMCLNDEARWSTRPKYEWRDGQRVQIGEEPVPLFQLRSMAQTRAGAKACRNAFAWVVVLAGFRPTPAEEMDDATASARSRGEGAAPASTPARSDGATTITKIETKTGTSKKTGKPWTSYLVSFGDGRTASTFDSSLSTRAEQYRLKAVFVIPELEQKGNFLNLAGLALAADQDAPAEEGKPSTAPKITETDAAKLWAVAKEHGADAAMVMGILKVHGVAEVGEITKDHYFDILDELKRTKTKAAESPANGAA